MKTLAVREIMADDGETTEREVGKFVQGKEHFQGKTTVKQHAKVDGSSKKEAAG